MQNKKMKIIQIKVEFCDENQKQFLKKINKKKNEYNQNRNEH